MIAMYQPAMVSGDTAKSAGLKLTAARDLAGPETTHRRLEQRVDGVVAESCLRHRRGR